MKKFLLLFTIVCFQKISAQTNFTAGNLVIYRVGTGAALLSNAGTAIFLDEYDGTGALVQSVALPTSTSGSNSVISASGTATSEGYITRSPNGLYLTFTGYGATAGTASIASSASATVPRVVGVIDYQKNINTSTALTDFLTTNNIRSALYDGTNLWVAGATGLGVTTLGATKIGQVLTSASTNSALVNIRALELFDGQLYASTASGTAFRVFKIGDNLPTTGNPTFTSISTLPASPYQFQMFDMDASIPGIDVMYVADDNATTGGVTKYSLVSGAWVKNGSLGTAADGYRGLTGVSDGGTVTLYATGSAKLIKVVDATGYNVAPTATASLLATAATNTAFRGISFTPIQSSALPLNFIHFTAKNSGNQSLLNWEMAADDNCKYFIVERSTNGKDFDAIANINGEKNKTVYSYRETYLQEGLAYYRIIGVEESGEKTYSSTQLVQFKVNQNFVVYPNPVTNGVLTLSLANYGVKEITLYNSFGQPVKSAYFSNTSTKINTSRLPKGVYYIHLKINNVLQPIKTIIIQ